eukprot:g576.t1
MEKRENVAVCFFGDGAASEGDFHASLNFAATLGVPVLFICRNNGYAISTPSSEQFKSYCVAVRGPGYGVPTLRVDGGDPRAIYLATKLARERCLQENCPVLLEAMCYRFGHHSTSDDSSRYRTQDETQSWKRKEPVARFRSFLYSKNWWTENEETQLTNAIREEAIKALEDAEKVEKPPVSTLFTDECLKRNDFDERDCRRALEALKACCARLPKGEPILILSTIEEPVLQNNRILLSPESLHAARMAPGELVLVSISDHRIPLGTRSSFAPSLLDKDLFWSFPPVQQGIVWNLSTEKETKIGSICFVCEIWPNSKLQKEQVQIPLALRSDQHPVSTGTVIYLHCFKRESPVCQKLVLSFLQDNPVSNFNFKEIGIGMEILKKLILSQIHHRVLLEGNLVPVLVLGGTLLCKVQSLSSQEGPVESSRIDSDFTCLEFAHPEQSMETDYLTNVRKASSWGLQGSQKEAAESGALLAAKQGLIQLQHDTEVSISDALSQSLKSLVISPITTPEMFAKMGVLPPKGVILYGPPGSGKSALVRSLARTSGANFFVISGPSLVSEYYGGSESGLTGVFSAAKVLTPAIIFFDELESVLIERNLVSKSGSSVHRMLTALLTEFDKLTSGVVVVGATNQIATLDLSLRRPGRFDREIEIGPPSMQTRRCIFAQYLKQLRHQIPQHVVDEISDDAHGFLPADISALFQEASMCALRRSVLEDSTEIPSVSCSDLITARGLVRPSGLREIHVEVPKLSWDEIGGLEDIKQQLMECIEWPIRHRVSLHRLGINSPRGVLLFGPPGCSKTLLAKAIASQTGMNFISVKGSELLSAFVGQSEKSVAQLFNYAHQFSPCVVFFDEIDGLVGQRKNELLTQRVLSQMLLELDGVRNRGDVVVIGATNIPQVLDPALLRPGRFDRLILVPPPDQQTRKAIFEVHLKRLSVGINVDAGILAERTEGFSGADIAGVCWEAGIEALEEDLNQNEIEMWHFVKAIERSVPSLSQESTMEEYKLFQRSVVDNN